MILASFWWICILKNLGTRTIVIEKYILITKRGYKMKKRIISLLMCGVLAVATLAGGEAGLMLVGATDIEQEDILPEMALEVTPEVIAAGSDELGAEAIEPEVTATPTLIPTATPEVVEEVEPEVTAEPVVTAEPEMTGGVTPEDIPEVTLIPENEKDLSRSARAAGDVAINATNFPDKNFRKYIRKHFDANQDNILNSEEIDSTYVIALDFTDTGGELTSLEGVEVFVNLEELSFSGEPVTDLDVSKNVKLKELHCRGCDLESLDLSKNFNLKRLRCEVNQLTELDVSKNTELIDLSCMGNPIAEIDVSKNTKLEDLSVVSTELTKLDVSKNKKLRGLYVNDNELTSLDVRKNTELQVLSCKANKLKVLDVSKNTKLQTLWCERNSLKSLNLSKNPKLIELKCSYNKLTSIKGLEKCTKLQDLQAGSNNLKTLPNIKKLKQLGNNEKRNMKLYIDTRNQLDFSANYLSASHLKANLPKKNLKDENWLKIQIGSQRTRKTGGVKVTKSGAKELKITWKKVVDAMGYKIYRATSKDGKYKLVKTVQAKNALSYVDTKLKSGQTYYYKIRAYKKFGGLTNFGAYSDTKSKKVKKP